MKLQPAVSFILGAVVFRLHQAAAQSSDCDVHTGQLCIDPVAGGEARVDFLPIFPVTLPRFVYGLQMVDGNAPGSTAARVAFWLEYQNVELSAWNDQETYMAVLMNENITGTPGLGPFGCDDVWGASCSRDLKALLFRTITSSPARNLASLTHVLYGIQDDNTTGVEVGTDQPIANLSCPWGVLNKFTLVTALGAGLDAGLGGT